MTEPDASSPSRRAQILRAAGWLRAVQLRIAAIALILMMAMTVADVTLRYALNSPIRGSYDFVEAMLVVFVFNGIAAVFFARANIVIDLVDGFLGERAAAFLVRVSEVLSIATLIVLGWAMIAPALQAYDYGDRKLELDLPIYVLWAVALAGMTGTVLCALGALIGRPPLESNEQPHE